MSENYELSGEEKIILKKHKELENLSKLKDEQFWKKDYPKFSRTKKEKYWLSSIHHGMRMQEESTGDPYSEFSPQWYEWTKSVESEFDEIFKNVVNNLGLEFDWNKYRSKIASSN